MDLAIRRMQRADLDLVLDWGAAEGWNPGLNDADAFFNVDPDGFFLATIDGKPVGGLAAVAYDDQFGFMGLYVVQPEYRGHRVGIELGKVGCAHLGSRTVGLDDVAAKQAHYRTWGFELAYRILRYEGVGGAVESPIDDVPVCLVDFSAMPLGELTEYDSQIFPADRSRFLQSWVCQPGARSLGLVRQGRMAAYGVLRPCRTGYKIGPLMADDLLLAEILFQEFTAAAGGELVYLDVPEPNASAVLMAQRHGMRPVLETARMYAGPPPVTDLSRLFGVTTLELG